MLILIFIKVGFLCSYLITISSSWKFLLGLSLIGDATSAASDGAAVQNSYDALEGGGLTGKALGVKVFTTT